MLRSMGMYTPKPDTLTQIMSGSIQDTDLPQTWSLILSSGKLHTTQLTVSLLMKPQIFGPTLLLTAMPPSPASTVISSLTSLQELPGTSSLTLVMPTSLHWFLETAECKPSNGKIPQTTGTQSMLVRHALTQPSEMVPGANSLATQVSTHLRVKLTLALSLNHKISLLYMVLLLTPQTSRRWFALDWNTR